MLAARQVSTVCMSLAFFETKIINIVDIVSSNFRVRKETEAIAAIRESPVHRVLVE